MYDVWLPESICLWPHPAAERTFRGKPLKVCSFISDAPACDFLQNSVLSSGSVFIIYSWFRYKKSPFHISHWLNAPLLFGCKFCHHYFLLRRWGQLLASFMHLLCPHLCLGIVIWSHSSSVCYASLFIILHTTLAHLGKNIYFIQCLPFYNVAAKSLLQIFFPHFILFWAFPTSAKMFKLVTESSVLKYQK